MAPLNVLLVEASRMDADLVGVALRSLPKMTFAIKHVPDLGPAREAVAANRFDVMMLGMVDDDEEGLEAVQAACQLAPHLPVLALGTRHNDVLAAGAVRIGAQDYLVKGDFDGWTLWRAIRRAMERKEVALFHDLTGHVLAQLDAAGDWSDVMQGVTGLVKRFTGADAVGVRLMDGQDCPYFVTTGFPEHFLVQEGSLCARAADGDVVRDDEGRPVLECLCGLVLGGRTDPSDPHFTRGGSFWTTSTTEVREAPLPELPAVNVRHGCNQAGYESMALVPIRGQGRTLGLLQVNDVRGGRMSEGMVRFLEQIAGTIGIGILRRQAQEDLRRERDFIDRVLAKAGALVVVLDESGCIVRFNHACQKATGYSFEEVRGQPFWEVFLAAEEARAAREVFADLNARRLPATHENYWRTREGQRRRIAWSNTCLLDEAGHVEYVIGTGIDVTDRHEESRGWGAEARNR